MCWHTWEPCGHGTEKVGTHVLSLLLPLQQTMQAQHQLHGVMGTQHKLHGVTHVMHQYDSTSGPFRRRIQAITYALLTLKKALPNNSVRVENVQGRGQRLQVLTNVSGITSMANARGDEQANGGSRGCLFAILGPSGLPCYTRQSLDVSHFCK